MSYYNYKGTNSELPLSKKVYKKVIFTIDAYLQANLKFSLRYLTPFMLVGIIGFPIFYLLYSTTETMWLDIVLTIICLLMLLYKYSSNKSPPYLTIFWFFSLIILLPFNFTFNLLLNATKIQYHLGEMIMLLISISLIANVALILYFFFIGVSIAVITFFIYNSTITLPTPIYHMLPLYILGVVLGGLLVGKREKNHQLLHVKSNEIMTEKEIIADSSRTVTVKEIIYAVSHELNQPLAAIVNYANGCKRHLQKKYGNTLPDNVLVALDKNCEQAQRAGDIIHALKSYVNSDLSNRAKNNINDIITNLLGTYQDNYKKKNLNLNLKLANYLPDITCDKVQIELVLINLINNAYDSLSEDSDRTIIIETYYSSKDKIMFSVKDYGKGIDLQVGRQIFLPFFSTKPARLGMGLSLCENIIDQHQGKISFDTKKNIGTKFTIVLPINGA